MYKDGLRHGLGTIHHLGGGQSDAVFVNGQLSRCIEYRYPCRFGTAIDGRCPACMPALFAFLRPLP